MFLWRIIPVLLIIEIICEVANGSDYCPNLKAELRSIRKRRHLLFPAGSNAVITISLAKAFHTHVPSGWMMTTDLDVMYPLPDEEFTMTHLRRKLHHRQKREFWDKLENALHLHNMDGHACMLRTICESKVYLAPPGRSLVHDLMRAILTAPLDEEEFLQEIGGGYDELLEPGFCEGKFDCPFSLLHFMLAFNKQKQH